MNAKYSIHFKVKKCLSLVPRLLCGGGGSLGTRLYLPQRTVSFPDVYCSMQHMVTSRLFLSMVLDTKYSCLVYNYTGTLNY